MKGITLDKYSQTLASLAGIALSVAGSQIGGFAGTELMFAGGCVLIIMLRYGIKN